MRFFILIAVLTTSLYAREESFDVSASAWLTVSEDLRNDYKSLENVNKVGLVRASFVTKRLSVRANFVHNEKYEKENYVPYGVATLKLLENRNFEFVLEGGRSNEHSILNAGTNTPKSMSSSYAPLSYNDMGWENEMIASFGEAQLRFSGSNGAEWQIGVLKGQADFDSLFTDTEDLVGGRIKYSKGQSNFMYGYFSLDQTFYGFQMVTVPILVGGIPIGQATIPMPTSRDVNSKFHAFSFDTYINAKHKIAGELMYVDTMKIYAFDLRWNFPYANSFTGTLAYHYNSIDFDMGKAYNSELKKGVTYSYNKHLSFTTDVSYLRGKAPFLTNGQAITEAQKANFNKDWFILSWTAQWDF
jgi:hypothetical protein